MQVVESLPPASKRAVVAFVTGAARPPPHDTQVLRIGLAAGPSEHSHPEGILGRLPQVLPHLVMSEVNSGLGLSNAATAGMDHPVQGASGHAALGQVDTQAEDICRLSNQACWQSGVFYRQTVDWCYQPVDTNHCRFAAGAHM